MPLKNGKWKVTIDGIDGEMEIPAVDSTGQVIGALQLPGGAPFVFRGMWNEVAQQLSFWVRWGAPHGSGSERIETSIANSRFFIGYQMRTPYEPAPGEDVTWTLTGYFDAAPDAGGSPRRGRYGWYASVRETV